MSERSGVGRRDLALLAAGAAATAALAGTRAAAAPGNVAGPRRRLHDDGGVAALDLPLEALPGAARRANGFRTPVIETTRFGALGVTWRRGGGRVRARWHRLDGRGWTGWRALRDLHHGPDHGTEASRSATDLTWTGPCDAVQLEFVGDHRDPVLALLDPRRRGADRQPLLAPRKAPPSRPRRAPRPRLHSRKAWGANEKWRNGGPWYNATIKQVHVHHTVSSNDYKKADVPAMIRAMYRYHTKSLGWSDIGYNFLVDRFDRIWVGRAGGPKRAVKGAHTLGFNHASVGVAVIGNFEIAKPGKRIRRALTRIASWKLDRYGRKPMGKVSITSTGSDDYPAGTKATLPVIDGHRDTNATACPGKHLYRTLPDIRRRTRRRIRRFRK